MGRSARPLDQHHPWSLAGGGMFYEDPPSSLTAGVDPEKLTRGCHFFTPFTAGQGVLS